MNTTRRGFLGSILGTYVATQLPWVAKTAILVPTPDFGGYRSILVLDDGSKIQGPRLQSNHLDEPDRVFDFVFEPLEILRPIVIYENILVDPNGHPLSRSPLASGRQALVPGQRFHLTHRMDADKTLEPFSEARQHRPAMSLFRMLDKKLRRI